MKKRVLSGIQPSGAIHLGNYLGAIKQHIEMQQNNNYDCFFFIADLHALTTVRDPKKLADMTRDVALTYLSLGLDPEKVVFFKQSDVPEHTELAWIFSCITPMGLLERAHAWKDAVEKGKKEKTAGLFIYPILMAADILLYKPSLVPVGKDQKQHIEIARDIATHFNTTFGEEFPQPQELTPEDVAVVPGTDGQKMSKSYGNTIDIFAPENILKKQIMGIVTDSTPVEAPKDPSKCNVFQLYKLIATKEEIEDLESKYKKGGFGYGEAKKMLLAKVLEIFAPYRKKRIELEAEVGYVERVLREGANRAKIEAQKTLDEVRKMIGTRP
ncbi:MAG: tryptophan--tRNA ligase [Candidatus Gracilibacteria bacterium]